jgi:glycosyltransferase involved in cell wall biosynthesis
MFSVLILTRDEAANLPACLASVAWCDDVVVLDSFSTDATPEIAAAAGARVVQRAFDDFASQRNFALTQIPFRHPWVFHLDADERFNEPLRLECEHAVMRDQHSAYFVPNRIIFLGKWIRHSTQYPFPQVRLVKIGEVSYTQAGHGQREDGAVRGIGHLTAAYDHFNFSKGIREWVEKHNRYSDDEAALSLQLRRLPLKPREWFSRDVPVRQRALKRLHVRLPMRWAVKFAYLYVLRGGFLDGYAGFAYCLLQGFYDFLISVKIRERMSRSM